MFKRFVLLVLTCLNVAIYAEVSATSVQLGSCPPPENSYWHEDSLIDYDVTGLTDEYDQQRARVAVASWNAHNFLVNCSYVNFIETGTRMRFVTTFNITTTPAWNILVPDAGLINSSTISWNLAAAATNRSAPGYHDWIESVFKHEVGHGMGIDHPSNNVTGKSIMNGYIGGQVNGLPVRNIPKDIQILCDDPAIRDHPHYHGNCPVGWTPPTLETCLQVETAKGEVVDRNCDSPIIIDVDGRGYDLCDWPDGVAFDVGADGIVEQTAWIDADSTNCFLVLDRNGNGKIDNGLELFGNAAPQPVADGEMPNGFIALRQFDEPNYGGNGDNRITISDSVFAALRLWHDANHNGVTNVGELYGLSQKGVSAIALEYSESPKIDAFQNYFHYVSVARVNGVWAKVYDVFLISAEWDSGSKNANLNVMVPGNRRIEVKNGSVGAVRQTRLRTRTR